MSGAEYWRVPADCDSLAELSTISRLSSSSYTNPGSAGTGICGIFVWTAGTGDGTGRGV